MRQIVTETMVYSFVVCVLIASSSFVTAQSNLEKLGVAEQSNAYEGIYNYPYNAINGSKSHAFSFEECSVSGGVGMKVAFWSLTLPITTVYYITQVKIYYREGYGIHFDGFELFITNKSIPGKVKKPAVRCYKDPDPGEPAVFQDIHCNLIANKILIIVRPSVGDAILELCYVEVLGCPQGWFGQDCENPCYKCFDHQCFPGNGSCAFGCNCKADICDSTPTCVDGCKIGLAGPYCNESCPRGWFGQDCKNPCPYKCSGQHCFPVNGSCVLGCNCKEDSCGDVTAPCLTGCKAGWTSQLCNESCPRGWYGQDCGFSCPSKCFAQQCFPINGSCLFGCNCLEDSCDNTETCVGGCKEGWTGQYCNEMVDGNAECHSYPKVTVAEEFALIKVVCLGYEPLLDRANFINYSIPKLPGLPSDNPDHLSNVLGIFENLTISIGQKDNNFTHNFTVLIKAYVNGFQYFSSDFTVSVKVIASQEYTDQLDNFISTNNLMNNSNFEEIAPALDYLTDPLDGFNEGGESTEIDTKVREVISLTIVQIKEENIEVLGTVANILPKLSLKPERLTEKAKTAVVESLEKISTSLGASNLTEGSEPDEILPILQNVMGASSNMWDMNIEETTLSSDAGEEIPSKDEEVTPDDNAVMKKKATIQKIMHIIDNIGNAALKLISNETKTIVIETKAMNLMVGSMDDRNKTGIKSSRTINGKVLQGSFQLPNMSTILGDSNAEFSYQMLFSDKNPYQYDVSARSLTTPMISLKINDKNQNPLKVTNLTQPVNIVIPNADDYDYGLFSYTVECSHSNSDNFFRFTVKQLANNVLIIKIKINSSTDDFLTMFATNTTEKVSLSDVLNGTQINSTELEFFQDASDTAVSWSIAILPIFLSNETCPFNITYRIASSALSCQYWDVVREKWSVDGCKVSNRTLQSDGLECQCNHLTDFAGGFFVMPNIVDPIEDILLFLTFFENPVVGCTVIVLWFLYFISFYWSRKADNKDASMTGIIIPFQSNLHDKYKYMICVVTGWRHRGGTTAKVSCFIVGTNGTSAKQCLSVPGRVLFETGSEEWFLITSSHDLGEINLIVVWHDNSGFSPSWYLSSITIEDLQTKQKSYFWCERWLGIEGDQAKIALHSISFDELKKKSGSQFVMRTMRDLRQNHFLLSIMSKTRSSDFTRVQRLSCAMCLLLCTMLTCLMFHGVPTDDEISKEVSGIKLELSLKDIIIGIESAFVMFPINFIIITLFLKTKPRISRRDVYIKQLDNEENTENSSKSKEKEKHASTSSKIFPWWMIFIAWMTVTLTSLVASFFVMLYGLKYGYNESIEWLVSFLTAFVDDVFVMEPLKVAFMAVILTFLLRRPAQLSESPAVIVPNDNDQKEHIGTDEQQAKIMKLSKETFRKSKFDHSVNSKVKRKINNLIVNLFFMVILLLVVHNHRSVENCYRQAVAIENQYAGINFKEIISRDEVWIYVKTVLMDQLGRTLRYKQEERLIENDFVLMGKFRIRQTRVEKDNCVLPPSIRMLTLSINCSSSLNLLNYDTSNYDKSWNQILSTDSTENVDKWTYHSAWELQATPIIGQRSIYSGGGYLIELKPEITEFTSLDNLSKNNWIDERTRGIFIEFTLYNPNMNLFSSVVLIIEFDSPGQPIKSHQITTSELYNYSMEKNFEKFTTDILFVLSTLILTFVQMKKAKQVGIRKYLNGFWNILSMFQILLCFLVIGVYSQRIVSTDAILEVFRKEGHDHYLNFSLAILWDNITVNIMAILLTVSTIKFIKLFTLNAYLKHLISVGSYAKQPMKYFTFMFIICLLSFVCAGNLLFGHLVRDFKTVGDSFMSLVSYTVNIRNFPQLFEASPFIGPIFLFLYMFLFIFCFMNLFTVIVMNSFRCLRKEGIVDTGQTSLLFQYFVNNMKKLFM